MVVCPLDLGLSRAGRRSQPYRRLAITKVIQRL
jgi:hypothetical protein